MSDDEFISYDDSDSGVSYSPEPDHEDEDDYIGVDDVGLGEEPGSSGRNDPRAEDDFQYEVLSTEKIVEHMVDCIKEVNTVIQIPTTTVRILLNHFKWDKEKLMERYYSDDQEAMFAEAKVVPPHKKIAIHPPTSSRSAKMATFECEICFLTLPKGNMSGLECGHFFLQIMLDRIFVNKDHG
jgi:ariadne-1